MSHKYGSLVETEMSLSNFRVLKGIVLAINDAGEILVQDMSSTSVVICDFLCTSSAPPPRLGPDDRVLYVLDSNADRGYVMGVIQKLSSGDGTRNWMLDIEGNIEVRCGKSSLTMRQDGQIVIKGSQIVSRASGVNKIKGAAVKIN